MSTPTPLEILEQAISDCGYWRYWTRSEYAFQLEFGGTRIYTQPANGVEPPSGVVAIRLANPVAVVILTRSHYECDLPDDWFEKLGSDQIEPFTIDYESFTLTDRNLLSKIIQSATSKDWIVGDEQVYSKNQDLPFIGFWAQNTGFIATAESMTFFTMEGELLPDDIESKNSYWWDYWHEYWKRKDTANPMPQDYACEVTIPSDKFKPPRNAKD